MPNIVFDLKITCDNIGCLEDNKINLKFKDIFEKVKNITLV